MRVNLRNPFKGIFSHTPCAKAHVYSGKEIGEPRVGNQKRGSRGFVESAKNTKWEIERLFDNLNVPVGIAIFVGFKINSISRGIIPCREKASFA